MVIDALLEKGKAMKIEVGKRYFTKNGNVADVLFIQPEEVNDPNPVVGFITDNSGYKIGHSWSRYGECDEEADMIYNPYVDLMAIGKKVYLCRRLILERLKAKKQTKVSGIILKSVIKDLETLMGVEDGKRSPKKPGAQK
jgi:DNA-directed RNA polymerase subunit N (RpoN/RPB10)